MTQTAPTSILDNAPQWSHPPGNQVVPSPWQTTELLAAFDNFIDGIINRLAKLEEALRYGSFRVEDEPVVFTFRERDDLAQAIHEVY